LNIIGEKSLLALPKVWQQFSREMDTLVTPRPHRVRSLSVDGCRVRPSVRLSVCPVPDSTSRMEGRSKLKMGRKEDYDTCDPWPNLEVERSKVKVTRPLNAVTESQPCLRNGRAYELQTRYTDGARRPASQTCAVTSKVKGQGYNVTSSVWRVFARNSTTKSCRSTQIGAKVVHATGDIPHHFQGQKVKGQGHQAALCGCTSHHLQGGGRRHILVAALHGLLCPRP